MTSALNLLYGTSHPYGRDTVLPHFLQRNRKIDNTKSSPQQIT
jgi:hypothetical protein